ncbi:MAG: hypothetical protein M0030_27990 [Actinomycetota bacterium]|nr:hypothetical protein [Actinomycetota bacterium]
MSRADSRRVPPEQIDAVVKALYAEADRLGWEHLAPQRRTALYDTWVIDPKIGAVLTEFMSAETARSWIKDGPMKEYRRARQGAGRYARFGSGQGPSAAQMVVHAAGPGAVIVGSTLGVKPFHCLASTDAGSTFVTWGEARNFRHLVWAALNHLADNPANSAVVVITETMAEPATAAEKALQQIIAERCSLELKYYRAANQRRAAVNRGDQ